MKTILISGLAVNASNQSVKNSQNDLGNMLEHMFADIDTNLKSCYDIIPEHGSIVDNTCKEEDDTLNCKFKCAENDNIHLLKNIVMSGYEVSCRCHQIINGKRYKVPCAWSDMPSCNQDYVPQIVPEYGSHCGVLSEENGAWQCEGSSCHLTCNHGYVPSDQEAQMSPRCTCNKFGDCSWFKPATCVQVNHQNGKCEVGEAPIGQNDCTGSSMGDLCQLQCPAQYKAEQFGIQRCECNSAGACDWSGDRGRCEDDIQLPPALAALAESSAFGGSLLSAAKCKTLPVTEMGFWLCDEVQTCQLVCPPGFEANQNLEISCLCANGSCTFQNQQSLEYRFQMNDIETINNFECMALIDDDLPDSVIMETGIDRCTDLPRIENGAWNCTHGTCNLRCIDELDSERLVVDCLADDTEHVVDWDAISCNSQSPKQKSRAHSNLANRNLAPLK